MTAAARPKRLSQAAIVLMVSLSALPASFLLPDTDAPKFALLLCWTGLCIAAVLANRMVLWALLCLGPLALVSLAYWIDQRMVEDPFGQRLGLTEAFLIGSLVTAGTGIMSIVRTTADGRSPHLPGRKRD